MKNKKTSIDIMNEVGQVLELAYQQLSKKLNPDLAAVALNGYCSGYLNQRAKRKEK